MRSRMEEWFRWQQSEQIYSRHRTTLCDVMSCKRGKVLDTVWKKVKAKSRGEARQCSQCCAGAHPTHRVGQHSTGTAQIINDSRRVEVSEWGRLVEPFILFIIPIHWIRATLSQGGSKRILTHQQQTFFSPSFSVFVSVCRPYHSVA